MNFVNAFCSHRFLAVVFLLFILTPELFSQRTVDTLYLPPIKVTSENGFGPYVLGSKRTNLYILSQLPKNTSEVIIKMIDSKDVQISKSHMETGSNLEAAVWSFESDTMGFPLSPRLYIEIHYQTDSVAIYKLPYTVYPDTVSLTATAGFGPFISNNYTFSDTSFHPVPQKINNFSLKHIPPRTDTIVFQIMTMDSVIVQTHIVTASPGTYLDSATFNSVRMDVLPLDTRYLHVAVHCQGGPDTGVEYHKDLLILPQKPMLTCIADSLVLRDSIASFVQNQHTGQALTVDSARYALIQNGPGNINVDNHGRVIYPGPYSFDVLQSSFSIEGWMQFNMSESNPALRTMSLMRVDSAWQWYIEVSSENVSLVFASLTGNVSSDFWTVNFSRQKLLGSGWHHLAFICNYDPQLLYPTGKFYLDGLPLNDVQFNSSNYDYIYATYDWRHYLGTPPLRLGGEGILDNSLVSAMDEVRIWARTLTEDEILKNYQKSPLQEYYLNGYWNFDDLRNRLNYLSDRSYYNNFGYLKNHASFIPQYPGVQKTIDTIRFLSSNLHTDSVKFRFIDRNSMIIDSLTVTPVKGRSSFAYDMAGLPYDIVRLQALEFFHPFPGVPLETDYNLLSLAPEPVATPQYNWNIYYSTPPALGKIYAPVTVTGFPSEVSSVLLGLRMGDTLYDTMTYFTSSIPYHHSLVLNGTNNWVETSKQISSPSSFSILFWVKTSSSTGGKIIGFTDNQNGGSTQYHDREILMEPDGSLRFNMISGSQTKTVYALNVNNDGEWHHVAVTVDNSQNAAIYIDGSLSQKLSLPTPQSYQGWWVIGRNGASKKTVKSTISEYFNGSLSEISIWNRALSYAEINASRFLPASGSGLATYFPMNEGSGTAVTDHAGSDNGTINGDTPAWSLPGDLSYVVWNDRIAELQPGTYTFFATTHFPFGPANGSTYSLGNFMIETPFPGNIFNFYLSEGEGYFSQGISLINTLLFNTNYSGSGQAGWSKNYVKYNFLTPDHQIITSDSVFYTTPTFAGQFDIDMGDAQVGSYISLETGYKNTSGVPFFQNAVSIPVYIHPMIPPKVNGNFGPFDQAIAPGTMQHPNTFSVVTPPLSDIDSIRALFYNNSDSLLGTCNAVKASDTLWTLTYDMSTLSPPVTIMNLAYYLGQDVHPAAVEGPYAITIRKTRPAWFDFLPSSAFSNFQQSDSVVTFQVITPFEKNKMINNFTGVTVPGFVPFINGLSAKMLSPTAKAYLKYNILTRNLEMNQAPDFYQEYMNLGVGNSKFMLFSFNNSQSNSYWIDQNNNLNASQNFMMGGSVSTDVLAIENIVSAVSSLVNYSGSVNPYSVIVKPTFKISVTTGFNYASRLHMTVDTLTGKWGSCGDLNIDADSTHTQAYRNSASYHFYSGDVNLEFSLGLTFFEGIAAAFFGLDGRVGIGYGHSYISIPSQADKPVKSAAFQVYGRVYFDLLWGWYEKDLWGPKLFYTDNFWGDNMSNCFPPMNKKKIFLDNFESNSSWPELTNEIYPVSGFIKMHQPAPHPSIGISGENRVFTWVESGSRYGERALKLAYMTATKRKFSDYLNVTRNNHALNSPATDAIAGDQVILCWAQTRHTDKTIQGVNQTELVTQFLKSQDIWYGVFDIKSQKMLQSAMVPDDTVATTSGRTEANPRTIALSDTRALIIWQVADLDNHISSIWFASLDKQGGTWNVSTPAPVTSIPGVKTQLWVGSTGTNRAIIAWLNATSSDHKDYKLMTMAYDGTNWSSPTDLMTFDNNEICNYFTMNFRNGTGGAVVTLFVLDSTVNNYEKVVFIPWNTGKSWNLGNKRDLLTESVAHLQLPRMAINKDGHTTIAVKVERIGHKSEFRKISQIDLFTANLNDANPDWHHIAGNPFVCDTNKQVVEIALSYIDHDTLMILTNEYPMLATNAAFTPVNGVMFGNPIMDQVLRCFAIKNDSLIEDVPEKGFFMGVDDQKTPTPKEKLLQCFPNPCSDYTFLRFAVKDDSQVKLDLYDLSGIHIATVADNELSPGSYELKLNTSLLKPGTYTCTLINGQYKDIFKIVVIK